MRIWDLNKRELVKTLISPKEGSIHTCLLTKDQKLIAGLFLSEEHLESSNTKQWIEIWDINNQSLVKIIEHGYEIFESFIITPDQKYLIGDLNFIDIGILEIKSGRIIKVLRGHEDYIRCLCISLDGNTIISSSDDNTTRIWDYITGQQLRVIWEGATNILITSDGKYLITNSTIRDFKTFELIKKLDRNKGLIRDVKLSPDERFLLIARGSFIKVWDFKTLDYVRTIDIKNF